MPKRSPPLPDLIVVDRASRLPLFRQVERALGEAIVRGELPPGTRLPSTRVLARRLGVSRNTVVSAFEELQAKGYLVSRVGSGSRVAPTERSRPTDLVLGGPLSWKRLFRDSRFPARTSAFLDSEDNRLLIFDAGIGAVQPTVTLRRTGFEPT